MNKALLSSKNMCWCTPQDFFDKLNAEFGFVLDPAATDKTAKCSLYYTPETDGLSQSWDRDVRYVHSDGALDYGIACVGGGGVRPLCNLKSEILVSYLNGENAEEQKKRAEAVDMMKHIAAAWDIDAEEVFGRADE